MVSRSRRVFVPVLELICVIARDQVDVGESVWKEGSTL